MNLFLTPATTFSTGLRWDDKLNTFVRCEPAEGGGTIFEIAMPTDEQLHTHNGALMGIPSRGNALDYSELHALIWGTERSQGLVRKVLPKPSGPAHPALSLAIARIVREELGLVKPLGSDQAAPGLAAEGNSASPSESGSAS